MSMGICVAVIGATGAVGRDLLEALSQSDLPVREYRLLASRLTQTDLLEVGGQSHRVHALPEDLSDSALMEGVDLVFLATPPEVSRAVAPQLEELGVATVEIGGALADQAPLVVAALNGDVLAEVFGETRLVCSPTAPALALAALLTPLVRLGASACRGTVLLSAGLAGTAGTRELSQQVVALLNGGTPERVVFPTGLAFDLSAQVGVVGEDGWTATEGRLALDVARLVSLPPESIALTTILAPLFVGVGLSLLVELDPLPSPEDIAHALREAPLLRLGDPVPGPRRLAGRPHIYVGRLRADPRGHGLHLWATLDNLRAGASRNAVEIAQRLLEDDLL